MPSPSTLAPFALTAFLLVALPGPNMVYLLARSVSKSPPRRRRLGAGNRHRHAPVLGAVIVAIGLVVGIALALAAGSAAHRLRGGRGEGRSWSRWGSGCVYLALGAYAALSPAHRVR